MTKRLTGYINVYKQGGTSRMCASRLVADNASKSPITRSETRNCVWRVQYDEDGSNPTIYVEPVIERKAGDRRDKNPWSNP